MSAPRWRVFYGSIAELAFSTKEEAEESAERLRENLRAMKSTLPVSVREEREEAA